MVSIVALTVVMGGVVRPIFIILVLALTTFAAGCSGSKYYQKGVEPTNLSTVQPGTTRQTIEELLGQPVESEPDGDRLIDTYEYNMGRTADASKAGPWALSGDSGGCFACIFILAGVEMIHQGYLSASAKADFKKQKGRLRITYAADDTASAIEVKAPELEDGPFKSGHTTRTDVVNIMGREPELALREDSVLVYRETRKTFLIIEFDGDVVDAVTTTTACTFSGICIVQTEDKRLPPLVFSPPGEDAIAKDFGARPQHGCAIYAYSDIESRDEFIDPQGFTLDQQRAGILHRRGYLWWLVSPGIHTLEILGETIDTKKRSPRMEIDCHPGETFYISSKNELWRTLISLNAWTKRVAKYLEKVGEKTGRKEIGKRRLLMNNFAFPVPDEGHPVGPDGKLTIG